MTVTKRTSQGGFAALLSGETVRRVLTQEGRTLYAAVDVVAALSGSRQPAEYWADLKVREPALANLSQPISFAPDAEALPASLDGVDIEGVLRLVQSIPTARAERVRRWLAQTARERLEEENNPELAVMRTRRLYESKGYSRRWVDKRLRGVSARHELTGEWYKRGATESDQYRALTNALMKGAFGMEVEEYRRHKNLFKTGENLRDHMSDLELALTALGETVAVALHRDHDSRGYEDLEADARDAGDIVAKTRDEIEARTGRPVVQSGNHRDWWTGSRRRVAKPTNRAASGPVGADASEGGKDTSPEAPATNAPGAADKAVA
jgi:DNA-damage-inducible protein D